MGDRILANRILLSCLLVVFGCTTNLEIGGHRHHFGRVPQNVVWFQIAGLSGTHIPLAKYTSQPVENNFFESAVCSGQTYDANYEQLRPGASDFFNAQVLSSKLISNDICSEFSSKLPIWRVFQEDKRKVSILEIGAKVSESLLGLRDCPQKFLKDEAFVFKRAPDRAFSDQLYEIEKNKSLNKGVYFEKDCEISGKCKATDFETMKYFLKNSFKAGKINFMQIRDYRYKEIVLRNDPKKIKAYIKELSTLVSWLKESSNHREKTLIVITGAEPIGLNYPKKGINWVKFEKSGLGLRHNQAELMSPVFAWGSSSELFCGVMDNVEISKRIYNRFFQKSFKFETLIESIKNR
jgi:hypothetical protein